MAAESTKRTLVLLTDDCAAAEVVGSRIRSISPRRSGMRSTATSAAKAHPGDSGGASKRTGGHGWTLVERGESCSRAASATLDTSNPLGTELPYPMPASRSITIDPRNFILPPFHRCPTCEAQAFGVLMIAATRYVRRCRECWHTADFDLPTLTKRVIYLDQFAISDMMKSLNPTTKGHLAASRDSRWRDLFRRLDRLSKLQLIVCPESKFHHDESTLSSFSESLKRLYELLSSGVTFRNSSLMECGQLRRHTLRWLAGRPQEPIDMSVARVVHGDIHGWTERLLFTWDARLPEQEISKLRAVRSRIHTELVKLFETWAREKRSFEEVFAEEVADFGRVLVAACRQSSVKAMRVLTGVDPLTDLDVFLPSPAGLRLHAIQAALREGGVPTSDHVRRMLEYLSSESVQYVPFLRIRAMLYAAVARKAAAGQKHPPTTGLVTDVEMVSLLLPYCDAMLVDGEIAGYLKEEPLVSSIGFPCKVFSPRTIPQFMTYLDKIETAATPEHLKKVEEVYGADWPQPFETLYTSER